MTRKITGCYRVWRKSNRTSKPFCLALPMVFSASYVFGQNWSHLWFDAFQLCWIPEGISFSWEREGFLVSDCLWIWNFNLYGCLTARPAAVNAVGGSSESLKGRLMERHVDCALWHLWDPHDHWRFAVMPAAFSSRWGLVRLWYQWLTCAHVGHWGGSSSPQQSDHIALACGSPPWKPRFWFSVRKPSVGPGPPTLPSWVWLHLLPHNPQWAAFLGVYCLVLSPSES